MTFQKYTSAKTNRSLGKENLFFSVDFNLGHVMMDFLGKHSNGQENQTSNECPIDEEFLRKTFKSKQKSVGGSIKFQELIRSENYL